MLEKGDSREGSVLISRVVLYFFLVQRFFFPGGGKHKELYVFFHIHAMLVVLI